MNKRLLITFLTVLLVLSVVFLVGCGHQHTEHTIPGVSATCTEDGYTDKIVCLECNEVILESSVIPATGHSEETTFGTPATCTEDGLTDSKKCLICGVVTVEATLIPAGHTEETIPCIEPTIGASGTTEWVRCFACNEVLVPPVEISLLSMALYNTSGKGVISGELTFDKLNGEFDVYYADSNKVKLNYYDTLAKFTSSDSDNVLVFANVVLPQNCQYLIADGEGDYDYFVKIPEEYLLSDVNYTFSALSDVHYNKGSYFNGALDFLDEYGVDFTGVCGDLTSDGEVANLNKFSSAIKNRPYKVYTVSGNHDATAVKLGNWKKYINKTITTDSEVVNVGENGLDFVFAPAKSQNNVFVFLCQTYWNYPEKPTGTEYSLITQKQVSWLDGVLEKYKDKNVFLFFHTFLSAPDGTQETAVGNLRNPGGYAYDLPFSYGTADEIAFRALLKKYKNVVFFNGHSHWMFEMEIYNKNLNYSNFDGEYCHMVHIPSVCETRWIGENDTSRTSKTGKASEGWIVEVHAEAIILIPVDFICEVFYTEYMKIIPLN